MSVVHQTGRKNAFWARTWRSVCQNKAIYLFVAISLVWYLVFCYGPMYGLTLAFKDFNARKGILHSDFVGLKHYRELFENREFYTAFLNTVVISLERILFEFPMPILIALLLNELKPGRYKKTLQTVWTIPRITDNGKKRPPVVE